MCPTGMSCPSLLWLNLCAVCCNTLGKTRNGSMNQRMFRIFAAVLLLALAACSGSAPEQRPDRVIRSRVVFLSGDLERELRALPIEAIRLWCPFVVGDLYGSVNTGDFINARVNADYTFEIDL